MTDSDKRWEPWRALSVAFAAGIVVAAGLIVLAIWLIRHAS